MSQDGQGVEYGDRLACGTAVADLLHQVADDIPGGPHRRSCAHCRTTVAELSRLWTAVHWLAAEPVVVPAGFTATVRRRIVEPVAPGVVTGAKPTPRPRAWVPLRVPGPGATRIGDTVIRRLARLASQSVPGVVVTPSRESVQVAVSGGRVVVSIQIRVAYGDDLVAAADAVRIAVVVQLLAVAGLDDVQVDVTVTSLHD